MTCEMHYHYNLFIMSSCKTFDQNNAIIVSVHCLLLSLVYMFHPFRWLNQHYTETLCTAPLMHFQGAHLVLCQHPSAEKFIRSLESLDTG